MAEVFVNGGGGGPCLAETVLRLGEEGIAGQAFDVAGSVGFLDDL